MRRWGATLPDGGCFLDQDIARLQQMEACDTVYNLVAKLLDAKLTEMNDYQRYWYNKIKDDGILAEIKG